MALKIIWNDIIDEPADVIVTPASRKPRVGTGLDKAIHAAAGERLLAARKKLGTIEPGVVKETPSFGLAERKCRAKWVVHALGPWCEDGKLNGTERPILLGCYLQILCKAVALGAKTVSVPVLSSGKFGMPLKMAVDTAVEAIGAFLEAVPKLTVKLVGIDSDFRDYAREKYPDRTELRYDRQAEERYRQKYRRAAGTGRFSRNGEFAEKEESAYFRNVRLAHETEGRSPRQILFAFWEAFKAKQRRRLAERGVSAREARENGETVLTHDELAGKTYISRRRIKRIFSSTDGSPLTRDEIVSLAFVIGIPSDYVKALWRSAGYPTEGAEAGRRHLEILRQYGQGRSREEIDAWLLGKGLPGLLGK